MCRCWRRGSSPRRGAAVGIDRATSSLQAARGRASSPGIAHARFKEWVDLATFDVDTLAIRMHEDALVHERVMFLLRVVGPGRASAQADRGPRTEPTRLVQVLDLRLAIAAQRELALRGGLH